MGLRLSSWMYVKTAGEILNRPGDAQDVMGLLLSPLGDAWFARSGPYNNGALPNGYYRIGTWQPKPATKGPVPDACRMRGASAALARCIAPAVNVEMTASTTITARHSFMEFPPSARR